MLWFCLIFFSVGFSATVLATPWVIDLAHRLNAIDAPDGFRKTHHGATPRMGGLAVAFGLLAALASHAFVYPQGAEQWLAVGGLSVAATLAGLTLVIGIGILDDQRGVGPMAKLAGQALVAGLLFLAGFRIERVFLFGVTIDFALLALPVTIFWFLGCMNIWNLIDGMDGLASGSGAIVAVTLVVGASAMGHWEVAFAAAALAGALVGFLVYNFHPAKVFLGDTGSLLLGTLLGMLAIRGSMKSGVTVAILAPLLAMGLPIMDTLLAIIRRWLRHLPWNVADRGHLHHRLMAFGLTQRQASLFLYSFTTLLCASAVASVALQSDSLGALFAVVGTLGLAYVFVARREQRSSILEDFRRRIQHRQKEQRFARLAWEAIQRLANCGGVGAVVETAESLARSLQCDGFRLRYRRDGKWVVERDASAPIAEVEERRDESLLRFSLADWPGEELLLEFEQREERELPVSVGARFLARFAKETLDRLRQLVAEEASPANDGAAIAERRQIARAS